MERLDGVCSAGVSFTVRKKRSTISRKPCSDSWKLPEDCTLFPPSTVQLGSGCNEEDCYGERAVCPDGPRNENRPTKLKLKLGGVVHTIHTKSAGEYGLDETSSIAKSSQCCDGLPLIENLPSQYSSTERDWSSRGKMPGESLYKDGIYESVCKSKRVPKRCVMDSEFDEEYDDDEIHFVGRLNTSRQARQGVLESDSRQMEAGMYVHGENHGPLMTGKEGRKKVRSDRFDEDEDYEEEEEEPTTDDIDVPAYRTRKLGFVVGRNGSTTNIRKEAIQSGYLEFPDDIPPAPPKKRKQKLSEMERQLKKAEAAQRRKMQSEEAAREAEAEAIRKIRGHDCAKKKKERLRCNEKTAKGDILETNTIRWIIGTSRSVVIFSDDIGLPKLFNSVPYRYSYPPPREKCAGPDCTNTYKYRDSESKLPLCSLRCYKVIHGKGATDDCLLLSSLFPN